MSAPRRSGNPSNGCGAGLSSTEICDACRLKFTNGWPIISHELTSHESVARKHHETKWIYTMTDECPNIFNSLLKYHPRDGHTPWENFLTEAIAYVLKTELLAMEAWLSLMLDRDVKVAESYVLTQNSERIENEASTVFPDLKVVASLNDGKQQTVYCEHKWDSPCNPDQLRNYAELIRHDQGNSIVAFVGATQQQVREARNLKGVVQKAVRWEDIYRSFKEISNPSLILQEFLIFMETQNLGATSMINLAHLQSLPQVKPVMRQLWQCANRLLNDFPWDFLDARYRNPQRIGTGNFPCMINRYGRIGIEFMTNPPYTPTINTGFLYDTEDHRVELTRPEHGIDLMLRIEADPAANPDRNIGRIIQQLEAGRKRVLQNEQGQGQTYFTKIRLKGETRNQWTLLIAQKCLADVIGDCDSEEKQLQAIYEYFRQLLTLLFSDPQLEQELRTLNPYLGNGIMAGRATGWPHNF